MNYTLVLNNNWMPISVISPFNAVVAVCREKAKAMCVDTYELFDIDQWINRHMSDFSDFEADKYIKTVSFSIKKPEIIILKNYGGIPFTYVNFTKNNLIRRDGNMCQYCNNYIKAEKLTIDHIMPRSKGGLTTWENCVAACIKCNASKGSKTLQECGYKLFKQPKVPRWTPIAGVMPTKRPQSWEKFIKTDKHV